MDLETQQSFYLLKKINNKASHATLLPRRETVNWQVWGQCVRVRDLNADLNMLLGAGEEGSWQQSREQGGEASGKGFFAN